MGPRSRPARIPALKAIAFAIVIGLLTAGSIVVYLLERQDGQSQITLGDQNSPDRIDISVFVQKTDPVLQELSAQVEIDPVGALADEDGFPRQDITVHTNGVRGDTLAFKAGRSPSVADLRVALNDGVITDYPFDSYQIDFGFAAEVAGKNVPISLSFVNADSFFKIKPKDVKDLGGGLVFAAEAVRSTGTFAFALFVMAFMWFLSLAAVIAAWFVIRDRRGLLWPSMSFMGALLFALVPLRNAVPGSPPIGSVVDFGSFFMAEALVSLSLITTVITGYRVERANARAAAAEAAAAAAEAEAPPAPALAGSAK
ncbi:MULTISPECIES: DUF4436 family protein [unclassified Crossiella]|uniref:DUF4436 family protein n=1 Tax=unclassified Crossiella TaxID=2620835 RepID=UPI001FFF5A55|nr:MULTISPECIES: DUF4436 family protein [unclassified Crossiella]MCK2237141.1 DUF4436 domain-containing protein [Crossiella sp. S99.2]MCK2250809.1 DUF4436 domain-containing protein [Crossiella sp. S99.1]